MLRMSVDGKPVQCVDGATILQAIRAAGTDVPTLCHDPRLKPIGACRLCILQVNGQTQPQTACNTPAQDGMQIQTSPPHIEQLRTTLLRLLARQYPADAFGESPDKPFHQYIRKYGLEEELQGRTDPDRIDSSHPYIKVDMSRCIDCFRCVRICEEVQGQFVWRAWNRGDATRIRPISGTSLLQSPCVSCGACADTCPTGAIEDQVAAAQNGASISWTRTVCPYCGTGCEMSVGVADGHIVAVKPQMDAPVNRGHLCVKGRYAFGFNDAQDRATQPLVRKNLNWMRVSWEQAIETVATGLQRIIDKHGADAVGMLGSARATNEENYLTQKFARVVLGTNNVDCCARVCHAPTAQGMKLVLGTGAATNSFDDIERAASILVCGANPTENHPIVGARIKQAALRGVPLIVIDPREIELARSAAVHLAIRPGTNVPLLNAIACAIVEEGLVDDHFLRRRVSQWEDFRRFIAPWSPARAAAICGVDEKLIRSAARIYATRRPAMCFHGLGVTEHVQGTDSVISLVNLALLTGNIGKPGSGINPLRGQNNVQGAAHMGCDPATLTGSAAIAAARASFEQIWRAPVPASTGLNLMQMVDAADQGRLKALWAIGYDVALTNPNASFTRRALASLDMLVVQDLFLNAIAHYASIFLPAASPLEKDGTFMNAERRIQRVRQVVPPPGSAQPDWKIICEVAKAMGKGEHFSFSSPEEIWEEIRAVWPAGRGITFARLDRQGIQWPCPDEEHPGTAILHTDSFAAGARAALCRVGFTPTTEQRSNGYPFLLITGRTLYQFNAGTMTLRTANAPLRPHDRLDMSPPDAQRLGLSEGDRVLLRSRYGRVVLPVHPDQSIKPGELFTTFHTLGVYVNEVTGDQRDRQVGTPQYKVTAVNVERA